MPSRAQWESLVITAVMLLGVSLLASAFTAARAHVRDDLRRDDLTNLRQGIEMYYNKHVQYLAPPPSAPLCTNTNDPTSWLFADNSPLLKSQSINAIPHDVREKQGHTYQYCATNISNGAAGGYYLQAQLEVDQPSLKAFDNDEKRKHYYRILTEADAIFYRVCGGTEQQCRPEK